jgi:hypothetical protein
VFICFAKGAGQKAQIELDVSLDPSISEFPQAPAGVAQVLRLVLGLSSRRSSPWTPEWIELSFEAADSTPNPSPKQSLPKEWMQDGTRLSHNRIRIKGRYASQVGVFSKGASSVESVDWEGGLYTMVIRAVLPGEDFCAPEEIRIGTIPGRR